MYSLNEFAKESSSRAAAGTDVTTGLESSPRQKQHNKTMQHQRALLFGNSSEFPSTLLTSTVTLWHFSSLTLSPCPAHEGTLVAEAMASQVTLPSLVLVCPQRLKTQLQQQPSQVW